MVSNVLLTLAAQTKAPTLAVLHKTLPVVPLQQEQRELLVLRVPAALATQAPARAPLLDDSYGLSKLQIARLKPGYFSGILH